MSGEQNVSSVPLWMKTTWVLCGLVWVFFLIPAWIYMLVMR